MKSSVLKYQAQVLPGSSVAKPAGVLLLSFSSAGKSQLRGSLGTKQYQSGDGVTQVKCFLHFATLFGFCAPLGTLNCTPEPLQSYFSLWVIVRLLFLWGLDWDRSYNLTVNWGNRAWRIHKPLSSNCQNKAPSVLPPHSTEWLSPSGEEEGTG